MTMDDYRTLEVYIDENTQWLPDITVNGGNLDGLILKVIFTDRGVDASPSLDARMVFNAGDEGDFRDMTPVTDAQTATYEAVIPRGAMKPGLTRMAVQLLNDDHSQIVSSRAFNLRVEPAVLTTDDADGMKAFEQYVRDAQAAEQSAKDWAETAKDSQTGITEAKNAAEAAKTAAQQAASTASASSTSASGSATTAQQAASTAEERAAAANGYATEAKNAAEMARSAAADASGSETSAQEHARDAENAATLAQRAVDGIDIKVGSVTATDPGSNPEITKTGEHGDVTFAFKLPRGEAGPSSLYLVKKTLSAGMQVNSPEILPSVDTGTVFPLVKGGICIDTTGAAYPIESVNDSGDYCIVGARVEGFQLGANAPVATQETPGVVKPGTGLTIDSDGTLNASASASITASSPLSGSGTADDPLTVTPADGTLAGAGVVKVLNGQAGLRMESGVLKGAPAQRTKIGMVMPGPSMNIDSDGTLRLLSATKTIPGGIKVGSGLTIDSEGILSVSSGATRYEVTASNSHIMANLISTGADPKTGWCVIQGAGVNIDGSVASDAVLTIPWASLGLGEGFYPVEALTGLYYGGAAVSYTEDGLTITPEEQYAGSMIHIEYAVRERTS